MPSSTNDYSFGPTVRETETTVPTKAYPEIKPKTKRDTIVSSSTEVAVPQKGR